MSCRICPLIKNLVEKINNPNPTLLKVKTLTDYIIAHEQQNMFQKTDISTLRELLTCEEILPLHKTEFDTVEYLLWLKNKKKRSHKKQSRFLIDIFEELGCTYTFFFIISLLFVSSPNRTFALNFLRSTTLSTLRLHLFYV